MNFLNKRIPWNKGKTGIYSPETLFKIGSGRRGKVSPRRGVTLSDETKRKISVAKKGTAPPNKGKVGIYHHTEETKNKLRKIAKSNGYGKWMLGKKRSTETKEKMSASVKAVQKYGRDHHSWNPDRESVRGNKRGNTNADYHLWARAVKNRDSWKCKISNDACFGRLEAHHILSWSKFLESRYDVSNGITLCLAHHPRKRFEETRLIPIFRELVSQYNVPTP